MALNVVRSDGMAARVLVAVAVVALAAIDWLYLGLVGPGQVDVLTAPFVFSYLAFMALLLLASLLVPPNLKPPLRALASAGLLAMAVIAAFSIGVLIMIPAMLAVASFVLALIARPRVWPATIVAAVLAVGLLVVGFQFSWNYLVCPPTGQVGGTTAGFFGSVSYDCNEGVLTKH